MAISFHLSAFADEAGGGIKEQIAALKAHGMTHIEPRGLDHGNISLYTVEQAKELKKILDDNGIGVSAIGSHYGKIEITDDFAPHFEDFKNCVEVANILGTQRIRMFSFFFTKGQSLTEYRDEVFERLDKMCTYSLEHGIWCCHENEKDIYGDKPERCLDIFETVKSPALKGVFDPANFVQCGQDTLEAWDMLHPYITYMHIKDANEKGIVVPPGQGIGNVGEILKKYYAKVV